jgi:FOG: FHA domain
MVQWDPFWQTGWKQGGATGQWNVWIVSNPHGNDYSVNPSPSPNLGSGYDGWDGIGTGYFQPRPGDRISITVTYDPSTNTLSGVATDQATEQSASFTLNLNGYFTPPNSGSYIFGVAGSCGRGTNWALLYVATQGLYAPTITSTTSTTVQTATTSTVTATSTVTSTVTATSTVTSTVTATTTQVKTVTQTVTTVAPQVTTTSSSTPLAQGAQAPNFYIVNVQGQQTTTFHPGDVVMLRVAPFGTFAGKLAIYYIGPTGAQSQPLTYVYCGSNVLSTTQDIQVLPVTQQTLAGRYTLYVAVYDCANNPVRTVQLEFHVQSANPPPPPSAMDPTLVAVIIAVIAALAGVGLALARRRAPPSPPPQPQPQQPAPPPRPVAPAASQPGSTQVLSQVARQPQSETKVGSPLAFLELPNGSPMPITESSAEFGRDDFKPYLPPETVQFISARHFRVYYAGGQWYIEDLGSTNGTLLNGQQIKGKGPLPLKPGDVISPAGVIKLVFKPG